MKKSNLIKDQKASQNAKVVNTRLGKSVQKNAEAEVTNKDAKQKKQSIKGGRSLSRGKPDDKKPTSNSKEKQKKQIRQSSQSNTQINTQGRNLRQRNAQKQKEPSSQDINSQIDGEDNNSDQILFKKGVFIAYFDPTQDDPLHFKIGKLVQDAFKNDQELQCEIFESKEKGKLEFFQTIQESCVYDHTVIQELTVEIVKSNLKKQKASQVLIKIKKQDANKIEKLIPQLLKGLKKESDDESQSSQDDGSQYESDESEVPIKGKKQNKGNLLTDQKQNKKRNKSNVMEDQEMVDENQIVSQDIMQIDSFSQINIKSINMTQNCKKRNIKQNSKDILEEDDSDKNGEIDQIQKRKKIGKSASQNEKRIIVKKQSVKQPKAKKVLTVFKLGTFNPDIQIIQNEPQKESLENKILEPKCCIRCNNKNIIRAGFTENFDLLKKLANDKQNISRLSSYWGPDDKTNLLDLLIEKGDQLLLELVLKPQIKVQRSQIYSNLLNEFYSNRAQEDPFLITFVNTGKVSHTAYGAYVRGVEMTRGSRQGNNAFLETEQYEKNLQNIVFNYNLPSFFLNGKMSIEKYQTLEKLKDKDSGQSYQHQSSQYIDSLVRLGEYELAAFIVKDLWAHSNFGFNELHYRALCPPQKDKGLSEFKSVSVVKKAQNNKNITPLHFACINPHSEVLKELLSINQDINIQDFEMRKPIHYAAACETPDNLQILLDFQANLNDIDMKKVTCLHVAAQANRAENMRFILSKRPQLLKLKDRQGFDAMAHACENQNLACIEVLLQNGAKINGGVGKEKLTPLHYSASRGNFELCEFLIEKKAKINSKDKFKRSPLVMAVRNGHLKVASLLLSKGADWNQGDSSSNTPLHYAAAYGWQDCIDLLLKAGADINAQTSWKITPINIAMLKNHEGCVKKFLEHPEVDVNCKDEKGRTLLTLSLLNLREGTLDFVKFLLQKGADPNMQDVELQTAMHYLAKFTPSQGIYINPYDTPEAQERQRALIKQRQQIQLDIADVLIQSGGSLVVRDIAEQTPFSICLQNNNEDLLRKLLEGVTMNSDPQIFHQIKHYILNTKYQLILKKLIENEVPKVESINILDEIGMTPFLAYIDHFCTSFEGIRANLFKIITYETQKQKKFDCNSITNSQIFDQEYLQSLLPQEANNHYNRPTIGKKKCCTNTFDQDEDLMMEEDNADADIKNENQELIDQKISSTFDRLIIKPFIELLEYLIFKKADPHMQVQKLKKFRDIEAKKKLLLLAQANKNGQITEEIQLLQKNEERAKRREEVLQERKEMNNQRQRRPMKARSAKFQKSDPSEQKKEKYHIKAEIEYDNLKGLQNAFHLAVRCPHQQLIQFLEKHKVNADAEDHLKTTPLNLVSCMRNNNKYVDDGFKNLILKLVSLKVRLDYPDCKGRTPFLNFYDLQNIPQAEYLLRLGANVNQIDNYGLFALKYAMIRRSSDEITKLVRTYKADINQTDNKGRNLLHHAINMSSSTADATFDIEQVLIDLGININLRDNRKRTPLHYAFVKMQKWNDTSQIDPIETVSSLCGCKGLEIDVQDLWMKTPLHYASQRGASICAMYLQKRGADLEAIDIYGNTPLGVGILSKHFNYGIILIQKNADVLKLVHSVQPKKVEQILKQNDPKIDQVMGDAGDKTMTDSEEDSQSDIEDNKRRKHRRIFDNDNQNHFYGSEQDSESEYSEDSGQNFEQDVFNQQNAFGFQVFNNQNRAVKSSSFRQFNQFGQPLKLQDSNQDQPIQNELKEPQSMFRLSIKFGQLGLAYLMLDQGYNLMKAMQDALDEKKFQLVLTFLGKNPDDSIIRQKNDKNQNLFHILSQNASSCKLEQLNRIYNALRMRGVNCLEQDGYGRTALHYAVESRNKDLVLMLLSEGADPTLQDVYGFSPLILYLKGKTISNIFIYNQKNGDFDSILKSLIEKGADINQQYTESSLKSIYFKEAEYLTTPIINFVRQYLENQKDQSDLFLSGFQGLILCGARFDLLDSDNCDVLNHAIRHNHTDLFKLIVQKQKKANLIIDNQDVQGKTAIHHIVKPRNFGSYENTYMIDELFKLNYNLQIQDALGNEPIQYSLDQKSGKLRVKLAQLTKRNQFLNQYHRKMSGIPLGQWEESKVQPEQDSELFLKEAQEKEDREMLEHSEKGKKKEKELVPVDVTGLFEKSYRVFCEAGKPWDAYLTKVDLKNGIYGDYVFYKIQLLHDSVRDLYVVFTRYGRIGEDGMNQRSPFNKVEDAKKEFCSIFKSKTGNEFTIEDLSQFQKQNKKYNLAKVHYTSIQHKDYLAPFNFEKCARSQLDKQTRQLLEEVANITMYQRAMAQIGIDTSVLPLSNINKQTIVNAMCVLKQLSVLIDEDQALQRKPVKDIDYDQLAKGKDKIVELSSQYYELIPLSRYKNQSAPPINLPHQIQQLFSELECLVNIEHASKVLLGALYRQKEVHPVDYVYQALNVDIQYVDSHSEEHQTIQQYVQNTNESSVDFQTHKLRVFRIQRKGESEQISQFQDISNHRLLFHGSQLYNYLGILSQGLRIAPPEAPTTGYMFGKGIYFADAFCKSINYAYKSYGNKQDSNLLLLCQVVLGKSKKLWKPEFVENLQSTFQSVQGVGRMGPDYRTTLTMDNGVQIPFGKMIEYKDYDPELSKLPQSNNFNLGIGGGVLLQHNEFIVYDQSQVKMRYLIQVVPKSKEELLKQK